MRLVTPYICTREVVLHLHADVPQRYREMRCLPGTILVFDDVQKDGDYVFMHFPGMYHYHHVFHTEWPKLKLLSEVF